MLYVICICNLFNPLHSGVVKEVPLAKNLIPKKKRSFENIPMSAAFPCL